MSRAERHVGLAFLRHGDALHVLGAPKGGWSSLRPLGVFTPDWDAVADASDAVRQQVHHAAEIGVFESDALDAVRLHGAFLFDELVPYEAKRWLREGRGTLSISLDPALLDVPWELLDTGAGALSLGWAMSRSLQRAAGAPTTEATHRPLRRALIVADPDGELDESYAEGVALHAALKKREGLAVTLRAADVDADFVRRHLRAFDLLHYAGHVDETGWRMADSTLASRDIARLAGGGEVPQVVFVNGCGGVRHEDQSGAMLDAWFAAGVQHVVGPLFDLPDRLGREAARRFYGALFSGAPIAEALRRTRVALAEDIGEGTTPWGAYVLYGDPRTVYAAAPQPQPPTRRATRLAAPTSTPQAEKLRSAAALPSSSASTTHRRPWAEAAEFAVVLALIAALTAAAAWWLTRDTHGRFEDLPVISAESPPAS